MLFSRSLSSNSRNSRNMAAPGSVGLRPRQGMEVDVLEVGLGGVETVPGGRLGVDAHLVLAADQMCGDYREGLLDSLPLAVVGEHLRPDLALEGRDRL